MGRKQRVKVLQVLQVNDSEYSDFSGLVFKIQVGKNSQPMNITYDQLKYCYPQALIDYYESKSDFFNQSEEREEQEEMESGLLDYDGLMLSNGSKVLEYVNSLTYCLPIKQKGQEDSIEFQYVRVYEEQTQSFYYNFICKGNEKESHSSSDSY